MERPSYTYNPTPLSREKIYPKGQEGVLKTLNLVTAAFRMFPVIKKGGEAGKAIEDKMIKSVDQMHTVSDSELAFIEECEKPAEDIIHYTLLNNSGIPEDKLQNLMYRTRRDRFYYNFYSAQQSHSAPQLYFQESYFDGFSSDDTAEYLISVVNFATDLIFINLRLAPKVIEIPDDLKPKFIDLMQRFSYNFISELESDYSKKTEDYKTEYRKGEESKETDRDDEEVILSVKNIDLTKEIIARLIRGVPDYNSRFFAFGGKVLVVLPHQTLTTAEFTTGVGFNSNIVSLLAQQVLDRFAEYFDGSYHASWLGIRNIIRIKLSDDLSERIADAYKVLQPLGLRNPSNIFDAYCDSKLPFLFAQYKRKKLDTSIYPH